MALYHTYRPQLFKEIVGQKFIVQTLQNAIKKRQVNHAYLFNGPRGTGKTSSARILAKAVNCSNVDRNIGEPCLECSSCKSIQNGQSFDLIEMDAATHTQVDNIRDINEKIHLLPSLLDFKVYIIDEVHMLSKGAFNALLKTLEEPPKHVIFILATTEIHQVPVTVISRCQRFDFQLLIREEIVGHLQLVAKAEGRVLTDLAADLIARLSQGGLRDALSLLDKIMSLGHDEITPQLAKEVLGVTDYQSIYDVFSWFLEGRSTKALGSLEVFYQKGADIQQLLNGFVDYTKTMFIYKKIGNEDFVRQSQIPIDVVDGFKGQSKKISLDQLLEFLHALLALKAASYSTEDQQVLLQVCLVEHLGRLEVSKAREKDEGQLENDLQEIESLEGGDLNEALGSVLGNLEEATDQERSLKHGLGDLDDNDKKNVVEESVREKVWVESSEELDEVILKEQSAEKVSSIVVQKQEVRAKDRKPTGKIVSTSELSLDLEVVKRDWEKILLQIKQKKRQVEAFLQAATPYLVNQNKLLLVFKYKFHKDQVVNHIETKELVERELSDFYKGVVFIEAKLESEVSGGSDLIKPVNKDAGKSTVSVVEPTLQELTQEALELFEGAEVLGSKD